MFTSVPQLIEASELRTEYGNDDPTPCVWHKQAEAIIAKVKRGRSAYGRVISSTVPYPGECTVHEPGRTPSVAGTGLPAPSVTVTAMSPTRPT